MKIDFNNDVLKDLALYSLQLLLLILYYLRYLYRSTRHSYCNQIPKNKTFHFDQLITKNSKEDLNRNRNKRHKQKMSELYEKLKFLNQENIMLNNKIKDFDQKIQQLTEIKQNDFALFQGNEQILNKYEILKNNNKILQQQHDILQKEYDTLQNAYINLQNEKIEIMKENKELKEQKSELIHKYQSLENSFLKQNDENVSFTKLSDY